MLDLQRDWPSVKEAFRARFPILTDPELDATGADPEQLVALIELRLGYPRESAQDDVRRILESDGGEGAPSH